MDLMPLNAKEIIVDRQSKVSDWEREAKTTVEEVEEKRPEVSSTMSKLENCSNVLYEALKTLHDRLNPVLSADIASENTAGQCVPSVVCPLARRIQLVTEVNSVSFNLVMGLINGLEI